MKLIELMENANENYNMYVKNKSGDILSVYDGKNSIDEIYNDCEVIRFTIYKKAYSVEIEEA